MTATSAATNRIAPYLNEPQKALLPLPATREGREALLTDAVFAALAALQGLLAHADPKVVMKAAEMILNLETTRQRHGRQMIGTEQPQALEPVERLGSASFSPREVAEEVELPPTGRIFPDTADADLLDGSAGPDAGPADPFAEFVLRVWLFLQKEEDETGSGRRVDRAAAEQFARDLHARAHRGRQDGSPSTPGVNRPPPAVVTWKGERTPRPD